VLQGAASAESAHRAQETRQPPPHHRLAGIIPVLAVQGGGYVVAGLALLVWLKERPGEPSGAGAQRQGRPELVGAEG
jgi:hypothetical protein